MEPIMVSCGVGRDSVGVLVGMKQRGQRPDLIIFSDVGGERPETIAYIPILQDWLARVGFPPLVVIKYQVTDYLHWPPYYTLEENCLTNMTLPGISIAQPSCSGKWKGQAIHNWIRDNWEPAQKIWKEGGRVIKYIGFEDSPHEHGRSAKCNTFALKSGEEKYYDIQFPLQQWGWTLARCIEEIKNEGLPVPYKSSCFFCLAMKPFEVDTLPVNMLKRIVIIETRAQPRFIKYASEKGWPNVLIKAKEQDLYVDRVDKRKGEVSWTDDKYLARVFKRSKLDLKWYEDKTGIKLEAVGVPLVEGLWRSRVRGFRGAYAKPGSMTEYIRRKGLLPSEEVDRLIAATPLNLFSKGDFERLGYSNWEEWLQAITDPAPAVSDKQLLALLEAA